MRFANPGSAFLGGIRQANKVQFRKHRAVIRRFCNCECALESIHQTDPIVQAQKPDGERIWWGGVDLIFPEFDFFVQGAVVHIVEKSPLCEIIGIKDFEDKCSHASVVGEIKKKRKINLSGAFTEKKGKIKKINNNNNNNKIHDVENIRRRRFLLIDFVVFGLRLHHLQRRKFI